MSLPIAVFASGGGSNLQAMLDRFAAADAVARVALVLSDRADAGALARAERAGVATRVVAHGSRASEDIASEMLELLERADVELLALAGYTRLVPAPVVERFRGRILNIHPALLPAFGGKGMYGAHVHRAVLDSGATMSGATVHVVDEAYDRGPIVAQWPVPVLRDDTPESLAARVLRVEHWLYPATIEAAAQLVPVFGELWTSQPLAEAVRLPDWADPDAVHAVGRVERPASFILVPDRDS